MIIVDEHDTKVDTHMYEVIEQLLTNKYVEQDDSILELGARYGSVSCIANIKLRDRTKHVVVEPDSRVWNALEKNKSSNHCEFGIVKGFIGSKKMSLTDMNVCNGYGTCSVVDNNSTIPTYTLDEVKHTFGIQTFTCLIADCEGYLGEFLNLYPELYDELNKVIFERDGTDMTIYKDIVQNLRDSHFEHTFDCGTHAVFIK